MCLFYHRPHRFDQFTYPIDLRHLKQFGKTRLEHVVYKLRLLVVCCIRRQRNSQLIIDIHLFQQLIIKSFLNKTRLDFFIRQTTIQCGRSSPARFLFPQLQYRRAQMLLCALCSLRLHYFASSSIDYRIL